MAKHCQDGMELLQSKLQVRRRPPSEGELEPWHYLMEFDSLLPKLWVWFLQV